MGLSLYLSQEGHHKAQNEYYYTQETPEYRPRENVWLYNFTFQPTHPLHHWTFQDTILHQLAVLNFLVGLIYHPTLSLCKRLNSWNPQGGVSLLVLAWEPSWTRIGEWDSFRIWWRRCRLENWCCVEGRSLVPARDVYVRIKALQIFRRPLDLPTTRSQSHPPDCHANASAVAHRQGDSLREFSTYPSLLLLCVLTPIAYQSLFSCLRLQSYAHYNVLALCPMILICCAMCKCLSWHHFLKN